MINSLFNLLGYINEMILVSAIVPLTVLFGTTLFITESPRFLDCKKNPKIV